MIAPELDRLTAERNEALERAKELEFEKDVLRVKLERITRRRFTFKELVILLWEKVSNYGRRIKTCGQNHR